MSLVKRLTTVRVALLDFPPPQFKLFMDSIIWAIKHTMRDIADTGLNCKHYVLSSSSGSDGLLYSVLGGHQ